MGLDINKEILYLQSLPGFGPRLGRALRRIQLGLNNLGQNAAIDSSQTLPAPATVQALTVKTDGAGNVHAVINDHNPQLQRGIHYFVEYLQVPANTKTPAFTQPHVVHLGASRTMHPKPFPAMDDDGNPVGYIFRAYSQYPGGHPGQKIHFGGSTPIIVLPGGTGRMTMLPSTGSGTASGTGQEGGSGFGKVLFRNLGAKSK